MLSNAKNLITGTVGTVARVVTGAPDARSEAAQKAARTRERDAEKRSAAAQKAAETRKAKASARSAAAKQAARTRRQRDARVEAMVEATRRD